MIVKPSGTVLRWKAQGGVGNSVMGLFFFHLLGPSPFEATHGVPFGSAKEALQHAEKLALEWGEKRPETEQPGQMVVVIDQSGQEVGCVPVTKRG